MTRKPTNDDDSASELGQAFAQAVSPSMPPDSPVPPKDSTLDKLAAGINKLADSVNVASREHRLGVWINVVAACFTACVGIVIFAAVHAAMEELGSWYARMESWEQRAKAETEQRNKQMAANASLAAGFQKMLEAQTAHTLMAQEQALEAAEKHALAAEVKTTEVQLDIAKDERAPDATAKRITSRYLKAKQRASQRGVNLDEF